MKTLTYPLVTDIPNLDTPAPYVKSLGMKEGMHHVLLPSGHDAICLENYSDVKKLLLDKTASRTLCNVDDGPSFMPTNWAPEVLINLDAPVHTAVREFVSHEFSARYMESHRAKIREITQDLLSELEQHPHPDMMRDVLEKVPAIFICNFLGIDQERAEWMHRLGRHIQLALNEEAPLITESWIELYGWVQSLVSSDDEHDDSGLIAVYKERAKSEQFSDVMTSELLSGTLMGIVLGGDNNVVTMLSKCLYAALAHPDFYESMVSDPEKVPTFIEEILRLMPLGTPGTFPRELTQALPTRAGVLLPGSIVYPQINAANRDPEVFDSPLEIRLDRPSGKHLQYGYGMHRCMGSALAQPELNEILSTIVEQLPNLSLAVPSEEIPWDEGVGLRRPSQIPVNLGV